MLCNLLFLSLNNSAPPLIICHLHDITSYLKSRLQETINMLESRLASVTPTATQVDGELERERARAKMAEAQTLGARHQLIALKMDWALREGGRNFGHLNNILTHLKVRLSLQSRNFRSQEPTCTPFNFSSEKASTP